MWFLQRILRISWTEKVINKEVLRRADVTKKLVQTIRKRRLSFLGHVYRKADLEREQFLLEESKEKETIAARD